MKASVKTHLGQPIERKPAWSSRPYRQSPARREFVHGPLVPLDEQRDSTAPYFIGLAVVVFGYFVFRSVM